MTHELPSPIVVDESSLIPVEQVNQLVEALRPHTGVEIPGKNGDFLRVSVPKPGEIEIAFYKMVLTIAGDQGYWDRLPAFNCRISLLHPKASSFQVIAKENYGHSRFPDLFTVPYAVDETPILSGKRAVLPLDSNFFKFPNPETKAFLDAIPFTDRLSGHIDFKAVTGQICTAALHCIEDRQLARGAFSFPPTCL